MRSDVRFGMSMIATTRVRSKLVIGGWLLVVIIIIGLIFGLTRGGRSSIVSLELVGYRASTDGTNIYADLRLTNNSTSVVHYGVFYEEAKFLHGRTNGISDHLVRDKITSDFGPLTTSVISQELTSTGWTAVRWEDYTKGVTMTDFPLNAGDAVNLKFPLSLGAAPRKVALLSDDLRKIGRHSSVEMVLRRWLSPVGKAVGIEVTPPNVIISEDNRLWCDQLIEPPEKASRSLNN
jgi:hypothetical protein